MPTMASALLLLVAVLLRPQLCYAFFSPYYHFQRTQYRKSTKIRASDPTKVTDSDSSPSAPQIQRKRRRRKADSFFLTDSQPTDANDELSSSEPAIATPLNETSSEAKQSECPFAFAMTFPRYRVDLSNNKNANNDPESEKRRARRVRRGIINKLVSKSASKNGDRNVNSRESGEGKNAWGAVVSGIVQRVFQSDTADAINKSKANDKTRKNTEAIYATEVKEGSLFRWITSSEVQVAESAPLIDEDFVAAAAFWRMASDIVQQQQSAKKWYLALPETTSSVASNLCDILNWYAELEKDDDDSLQVSAQLDSRSDDVPVIQFTVSGSSQHLQQQSIDPLPSFADTERQTKAWVTRLLVELGVCPFTKSNLKSGQGLGDMGVPVANIMYRHSNALSGGSDGIYLIMADAWEAISDMVAAGPKGKRGVSSILLSAPGFDDDFALWAGPVFAMLEAGVSAIQAEEMIGVVCFHPKYVVPDGKSWPGFGHMHSLPRLKNWYNQYSLSSTEPAITLDDDEIAAGGAFQRRTPHAVINVLRAEQLEAAEGRRSTGELYERNIRVLMGKEGGIGLEKLTNDLRLEQQL